MVFSTPGDRKHPLEQVQVKVEPPERDQKSRFLGAQVVAMLREHEAGNKFADLCRVHGISQPTCHGWRSKYAGPQPSELKELNDPRSKYNRLEKMYIVAQMDRQVLKEIIEGKF